MNYKKLISQIDKYFDSNPIEDITKSFQSMGYSVVDDYCSDAHIQHYDTKSKVDYISFFECKDHKNEFNEFIDVFSYPKETPSFFDNFTHGQHAIIDSATFAPPKQNEIEIILEKALRNQGLCCNIAP